MHHKENGIPDEWSEDLKERATKLEQATLLIIEAFGDDPNREGLRDTGEPGWSR